MAGCAIACVAFLLKISYTKAKDIFEHPERSFTKGFYCREIVEALNKAGLNYSFSKYKKEYRKIMQQHGTIVFVGKNENYPMGHFLVRAKNNWMNSWINFPHINSAKSGFQKELPGKPQWIIYPR